MSVDIVFPSFAVDLELGEFLGVFVDSLAVMFVASERVIKKGAKADNGDGADNGREERFADHAAPSIPRRAKNKAPDIKDGIALKALLIGGGAFANQGVDGGLVGALTGGLFDELIGALVGRLVALGRRPSLARHGFVFGNCQFG